MKLFFTVSLLFLIGKSTFGQLVFKNKGTASISVCIGYYMETDTFKGWITEGWYTVKANEIKCIVCHKLDNRYYYYYAITQDSTRSEYTGNTTLRIRSQPFKIKNADQGPADPATKKKYFYKAFRLVDTEGRNSYTVTLGGKRVETNPVETRENVSTDSTNTAPAQKKPE